MTSDLTKEVIFGSLSVFFTALFAGIPGMALFWWTYQRDQERLIVEKARPREMALEGKPVFAKDSLGPVFGIVIRNRSLFSVHVSAVGFEIDGEVIPAEHPAFPLKMKKNPDPLSNRLTFQMKRQIHSRFLAKPLCKCRYSIPWIGGSSQPRCFMLRIGGTFQ